jgi:hypothetical protein
MKRAKSTERKPRAKRRTPKGPATNPPTRKVAGVADPNAPIVEWSTRDPAVIRKWARLHQAEPATGEATSSGRASSMRVDDGGSGLRFNFPGASRFREISWDEWFEHFGRHDLLFVCDDPDGESAPGAHYRLVHADEVRHEDETDPE